jgi:hypothetical protein
MSRLALIAALAACCLARGADGNEARLLKAIGQVESGFDFKAVGDSGRSFGAYQMQAPAIAEANARLASHGQRRVALAQFMRDTRSQTMLAQAYLAILRSRFASVGITTPTNIQLATAWNMGFEGARRRGFVPNEYARRVTNQIAASR